MKRILLLAGMVMSVSTPASAATVILNVDGDIVERIEGLIVDNVTYNVTFTANGFDPTFAGSDGARRAGDAIIQAMNGTRANFVRSQNCCSVNRFIVQDVFARYVGLEYSSATTSGQWEFAGRSSIRTVAIFSEVAVPEPATWAMMIGGFGLVGGAIRRQRASVTSA